MIYIHWLLFILYALIVLGMVISVLMENRQPAKTMAWIMVLVFLPIVGILLYVFFGRNTRKERLISQQSVDQLTKRSMLEFAEQRELRIPKEHEVLVKLFAAQNWALPFNNNVVDIFTDGYQMFHALLQDIKSARQHIHLDTYIFNDDALGYLVSDALIAKAREGVEVRVIYDDVGCWDVDNEFFERMREAGIEVHAFMPVKFPAFTSKVNYRNHRKLCVIDGVTGYVGGMNIATRYVKGKDKYVKKNTSSKIKVQRTKVNVPWRDTHLRIRGGAVYGIQRAFLVDWYFVDRTLISNRRYYPEYEHKNINSCVIQIVTSSPVSQWPDIMQGYVRILLEARKYVYMETPYFLPTEPVLFAMRTAALAGVDVRLIVPARTDAKFVEWASRSYVHQTLESGVKVYFYEPGFNHSKLLVSDDSLCSCGSANVDFRSFENNFECNAFIYDRDMALRMKDVILEDVRHCTLLDDVKFFENRPFLKRLWESAVRMMAPLM